MRLKQYINEANTYRIIIEDDYKAMAETIKKDCRPYLQMLGGYMPFVKGIKNFDVDGLIKRKTQKIRKPIGMKKDEAVFFNKWLKDNGHTTRDGSVIVTSSKRQTAFFGIIYYVFPIGNYNYTWIESRDVNMSDQKTGWGSRSLRNFMENPETFDTDYKTRMKKPFKDYFHTNKDWLTSYKNGFEIWFNCKSYYLLRDDQITDLMTELK